MPVTLVSYIYIVMLSKPVLKIYFRLFLSFIPAAVGALGCLGLMFYIDAAYAGATIGKVLDGVY